MVKSPDLLSKKVGRREMLEFAGIGLGILAAGACAEETGSAGPADPTANTKPVPRPTPEAATPTPVETAKPVEQRPLPDPEQLISFEKAEELFAFPNWKSAVAEAGSEKAAADSIAEKLRDMVDGILNPLSLVSEEDRAELGLGQRIQNEELNNFRENQIGRAHV